ncbi:hypothetical protein ACHQM5_009345 [Ranunculus cassubicifolius]
MAEKQLIVVIEGTSALGPYWASIVTDYLEKIIRSFCAANDSTGQKLSAAKAELSMVVFNAHGSYSAFLVQRSGWTKNVDLFLHWLSSISFTGGGFSDVAIAEGLAEALNMFPLATSGTQSLDVHKHCILVAASNPYPLPTPVYQPKIPNTEQGENIEVVTESCLADAETLAKSFAKCSFSLSVISPKQLPKLRAIYNAGKRNPRAAEPSLDNIKNPYFLILLSENFTEARNVLSRPGMTNISSNQVPVKMDTSVNPVSGPPPTSISSVNGTHVNRQPVSAGILPTATVKVEPSTVSSMVTGPGFPHLPSVSHGVSQSIPTLHTSSPPSTAPDATANGDSVHEFKPVVNANVNILNNLSQVRLQSMGGPPVGMHMPNMMSSGMVSSGLPTAQNVFSSGPSGMTSVSGGPGALVGSAQIAQSTGLGSFASATSNMSGNSTLGSSQPLNNLQGPVSMGQSVPGSVPGMNQGNVTGAQIGQSGVALNQNGMNGLGPSVSSGGGTMIPTPGMSQPGQPGMQQPIGVTTSSTTNMPLPQQAPGAMQSAPAKYVKVWEGALSGQRQGQPVFITKLEGYRSASASETLAADWPPMMQIVRLISQDHMNNKQYVGKADFLVFRAVNQHGFLGQLQEKKLCAVIQLPSQTLLLSVSDKASRLIGMLFPGDMVVFKPQIPGQQPPQQLQQQASQQPSQQQMQQQMQQQQQLQQQQQHNSMQQQLQQQQLQQQQQQSQQQQQQSQQQQLQQQSQQQQLQQQSQQQQQQQHQQIVGALMGQGYGQAQNRSQMMSQGQMPSQGGGAPNMPGGGFMS